MLLTHQIYIEMLERHFKYTYNLSHIHEQIQFLSNIHTNKLFIKLLASHIISIFLPFLQVFRQFLFRETVGKESILHSGSHINMNWT